ncbi:hypothetical protein D3C81_1336330 [compost metagenome]
MTAPIAADESGLQPACFTLYREAFVLQDFREPLSGLVFFKTGFSKSPDIIACLNEQIPFILHQLRNPVLHLHDNPTFSKFGCITLSDPIH